jgi:hypothetical protein
VFPRSTLPHSVRCAGHRRLHQLGGPPLVRTLGRMVSIPDRADLGSETPDDVRQLCMPPGRILRSVVKVAVFDGLKHHAICSLDLAIAPWVGHRGVVDVDEAILAKIPEVRPCKGLAHVGDNPVTYPELMGDVLNELRGLKLGAASKVARPPRRPLVRSPPPAWSRSS